MHDDDLADASENASASAIDNGADDVKDNDRASCMSMSLIVTTNETAIGHNKVDKTKKITETRCVY